MEVKKETVNFLKTLFSPRVLWSHEEIRQPVLCFLVLYYAIFFVYFFAFKDCCIDPDTMQPNLFVDPLNCVQPNETMFTKDKFMMVKEEYSKRHVEVTKILTFFLGFYVATMMKRWWDQISSLPDITPVAMALNGWVQPLPNSLVLKKTILRYCLLSYNSVMIQITGSAKNDKNMAMDAPKEKGLLLPEELGQFNAKNSRHWWVPINAACTLVQANTGELIRDGKDLMAAIGKFQCTLHQLMQFYENPMPCLCAQVVHLACWIYVILGSFAIQSCSGNHSSMWLPILVCNLFAIDNSKANSNL